MARVLGVNIPSNKKILYSLTYIYGIGLSRSKCLLFLLGIDPNVRTCDLTDQQLSLIRETVDSGSLLEGDLRRSKSMNIKRLIEINSYRGRRHRQNLPVRGQRSKTNSRTRRK